VPAEIDDKELLAVGEYRSKGRIPAVVWRNTSAPHSVLARSSQPHRGLTRSSSSEDEHLINCIRLVTKGEGGKDSDDPLIQWMDARPRVNALVNQMTGAGYESTGDYKRSRFKFLGIGNIHVMRESLARLSKAALEITQSQSGVKESQEFLVEFQSALSRREETTSWLEHVSLILKSTKKIMKLLLQGTSVVIHCSDGWDRTPQLTATTQLLLDPHYRTLEGFAFLIEKEWLSFGHKFNERIGHADPEHGNKQRAPIFYQWIECMYQLCVQFPTAFEFNPNYLDQILHHSYSCIFGTFLCNSEYERLVDYRVPLLTSSLWTHLLDDKNKNLYVNKTYNPNTGVLWPAPSNVQIWMKLHFPFWAY